MNYSSYARNMVKKTLSKKTIYRIQSYITLPLVKYWQKKLKRKIYVRKGTSDINVFSEIFLFKDYNYDLPIQPKTIVDAGANVGYGSLWFRYLYPESHIVAIEPENSNFEILKKNINNLNIYTINKGLWHKKTKLQIVNQMGSKYGFVTREVKDNKVEGIETCTGKELLEYFRSKSFDEIDLFKIDIEGAEKELFNENYDAWLSKTKIIIIELHERSRVGCEESFINAIKKYDFDLLFEKGENLVYINKSLIKP